MSYDEGWEIERNQLVLSDVLGEGAFGRVIKAKAIGLNNMPDTLTVAVKMLKGMCLLQVICDVIAGAWGKKF